MIEVRFEKGKIIADTGKDKYEYEDWSEFFEYIPEIKNFPEEKVFTREGTKLERIRV